MEELIDELARLRRINAQQLEVLKEARSLCGMLGHFNWGASALSANDIRLLNEVPKQIDGAIEGVFDE